MRNKSALARDDIPTFWILESLALRHRLYHSAGKITKIGLRYLSQQTMLLFLFTLSFLFIAPQRPYQSAFWKVSHCTSSTWGKNVNKRWQKESFVSSSWGKAQKIPLESPLHNNLDFSHFQPLTKKLNPPEFLFWDPSIPIFVKQPPGFFHLMPEIAIFWEKAKRRIFERRLKGESLRDG